MIANKELQSRASNLVALTGTANGLVATLRERAGTTLTEITVGSVVNCTEPSSDLLREPLLAQLHAEGLIVANQLRLGLEVADDYRVRSATRGTLDNVYYAGPLLKARD